MGSIIMRVHRVLVIFILAAAIVTVSGCIEFGAMPASPTSTAALPTVSDTATPRPQIPDSQVGVILKDVTSNQTSDGQQLENLVLTLTNTGSTDLTSVRFNYIAKDPVADELLRSGSVSVGAIPAGGQTDVFVSLPRYEYLRAMTFSANVCWGNDPEYVNDQAGPWSISLVTHQFWEK
ncbi:hypothetical protein [Methanocella arvoryzae]|nr:hypothetical protein [Methanocella arvoryzae]